jgi:CheY-like chemotaxis protein
MRVLVVDDKGIVRKIIRSVLAKQGYEVIEAENGLKGLNVAKQQPCELVITEQLMPVLNGTDLIAWLLTDYYPARYLLISGYNFDQPVQFGLAFLAKPFTAGELFGVVDRLQHQPTLPELEKECRQAKSRWQEAVAEFKEVISDVPSEISHPDGVLRVDRIALKQNTAYERYSQAFHNYKAALQGCGILGLNYENLEPEDLSE